MYLSPIQAVKLSDFDNISAFVDRLGSEEAFKLCREDPVEQQMVGIEKAKTHELDVAHTCIDLGDLLSNTGRIKEAERYYREALEIRRRLSCI